MKKKIYFAGSIWGGHEDVDWYNQLITYLKNFGQVLTAHVGDKNLEAKIKKKPISVNWIYQRDMKWMKEAEVLIAEVTKPSLGVGYEIAKAESYNLPILCLYRKLPNKRISALIQGNSKITIQAYKNIRQAEKIIENFIKIIS